MSYVVVPEEFVEVMAPVVARLAGKYEERIRW